MRQTRDSFLPFIFQFVCLWTSVKQIPGKTTSVPDSLEVLCSNQLMPYQKFRQIDVHSLCHREWFYNCHVIFPRSIKDGLEPVFDIAVLSFKRAWQVFLWESKFEWKRMFSRREDRVGAYLTRSCQEMQESSHGSYKSRGHFSRNILILFKDNLAVLKCLPEVQIQKLCRRGKNMYW